MQIVCDIADVQRVGRALAQRADVRFVSLVTGPFDVVAEMIMPSYSRLATVILEELPDIPGITHTTTETVVRNFKMSYDWSRTLLDPGAEISPQAGIAERAGSETALDEIDVCLVAELRAHGRASFAELAERCGITESMARRHTEHLLTRGGVRPITLVDPAFLGYQVELMVWLRVDLGRIEEIATSLAARYEVRYVSATSGYSDLVCEVILRSPADSYMFLAHGLGSLPGIREVNVAAELVTLKRANVIY